MGAPAGAALLLALLLLVVTGCAGGGSPLPGVVSGSSGSAASSGVSGSAGSMEVGAPEAAVEPEAADEPEAAAETPVEAPAVSEPAPAGPVVSDGVPRDARLSVPALGLADLAVVAYEGRTDDAAGTAIQDEGSAASPYGPEGGVGPGGIGNFQVTAHRNTAGGPFFDLPELGVGAEVRVAVGTTTYVYRIVATRETSFRSPRSLREQRAAVPGKPGATPTRAMLTLSTCATQEDHAAGNYWAVELDNPEHRIDKIGVLVRTRGA